MIDPELVKQIVREVVTEAVKNTSVPSSSPSTLEVLKSNHEKRQSLAKQNLARWLGHEPAIPAASPPREKAQDEGGARGQREILIPEPRRPDKIENLLEKSPARLGVWRTGTRYLTKVALKLRADHAVAKDAVYAELPQDFAKSHGWISLRTKAKDKEEYLLRPDLGRALSEESLQVVLDRGIKNPDIQIIVADGLSPWAAERNAKPMVDELVRLFAQERLTVGTIFCVRYSRIAIQDVIGEALGAKVSMIILGERPGLGGGDSLSNYMIYGPKVGAVNALKSMISNIHPAGHSPEEAARLTVSMVKKMFEQNCSGINLRI